MRTARVQLDPRLIGDCIYHADGVLAEAGNRFMSGPSFEPWYERLRWLYGGIGLDA